MDFSVLVRDSGSPRREYYYLCLVGEKQRVPDDRPIDGIDASAFLVGRNPTTGRDHVTYYGSDAAVISVKWRDMKVVFRYSEGTSGPIIKPQWPLVFDLLDDPCEEWDLIEKRLDCAWVFAPVSSAWARSSKASPATPILSRVKTCRKRQNHYSAASRRICIIDIYGQHK